MKGKLNRYYNKDAEYEILDWREANFLLETWESKDNCLKGCNSKVIGKKK